MTNQEILEKAISLAIDGGFMKGIVNNNRAGVRAIIKANSQYDLIFDHNFAKALWGEKLIQIINMEPSWRYHLQQMVIAEDPIKYLGQNL